MYKGADFQPDAIGSNPFLPGWCEKIRESNLPGRVVLAEGDDPRVRKAAEVLVDNGIESLLICRDEGSILRGGNSFPSRPGVETTTIAKLAAGPAGRHLIEVAHRLAWSEEVAASRIGHPIYLAAACVRSGIADACVAGSGGPTADVLRAGLNVIGMAPTSNLLSSSFLLLTPDNGALAFGDCAVVPEPSEKDLAEIAIATANSFRILTGSEPVVAMLSFSTHGSAEHDSAVRVRNATELVRKVAPSLKIDGEMQFDAAIIGAVAARKAPRSAVAGNANVLIFPNLSAGNIGYKIAQRLGKAQAIGPVLSGLNSPMNDLSRGCSPSDVVNVAAIGVLQATELGCPVGRL